MATYVLVHGTWYGSWAWKEVARLLRAAGHEVYTPSLTGIGERAHLAAPDTNLDTHVQDVVGTLICEDLREVILVGWSYGGMVITGAAEREPARIARLVYLDALVPRDGVSVADLIGPEGMAEVTERARTRGGGWRFYGAEGDPRSTPQPLQTYLQPVALSSPAGAAIPRSFLLCTGTKWGGAFGTGAGSAIARGAAAAREAGWQYLELPVGHLELVGKPGLVADALLATAAAPVRVRPHPRRDTP